MITRSVVIEIDEIGLNKSGSVSGSQKWVWPTNRWISAERRSCTFNDTEGKVTGPGRHAEQFIMGRAEP